MPFLPASGAISINDLNTFFTGSGTAMSNFYRGGGRVPSTKTTTTTTREPASGTSYGDFTFNFQVTSFSTPGNFDNYVMWDGVFIEVDPPFTFIRGDPLASITVGNTTYYRGTTEKTLVGTAKSPPEYSHGQTVDTYRIHREVIVTATVNINTSIPTSGQISLNQFYGAEVP
jgi:hypothetical protein